MKYKKYNYLIASILMLVIGMTDVFAYNQKECYYISEDNKFKAVATIKWGHPSTFPFGIPDGTSQYADVRIDKDGNGKYDNNDEHINNWYDGNGYVDCTKQNMCFSEYYDSKKAANNASNPPCPKYLVVEHYIDWEIWGTESETFAKSAAARINSNGGLGIYATYKNKDGNPITKEDYYAEFKFQGIIDFDAQGNPTCADYDSIFGRKDDPDSLRGIADTVLSYVRVLVPILIILLGTLDLSKAVIAGKEDNIKKAQTDFIKRVIIGVAIFFVPLLVNLVMDLADIVWDGNYIHCNL